MLLKIIKLIFFNCYLFGHESTVKVDSRQQLSSIGQNETKKYF